MSGGHWDYIQYRFTDISKDVENLIDNNGKEYTKEELKSEWGYRDPDWYDKYPEDKFRHKYPDNVLDEFKKALEVIDKAQIYIQRLDWLLSGDDGEESFISKLNEELKEYEKTKNN